MNIRKEEKQDYKEIESLIELSFRDSPYSDHQEQYLVTELRLSPSYLPDLTLVALEDHKIIGYIMMTEGYVGKDKVLILAPLCVHPNCQHKGVGKALIEKVHTLIPNTYSHSIVLGEDYYLQFGYNKMTNEPIQLPQGIEKEYIKIKAFKNKQISGPLIYPEAFHL